MIKFFNVRSGETVEATSEPMIAAYFNSSDLNPNGIVQDYGWRLHPNTVKRIREIEEDDDLIEKIADKKQIPLENVSTYHILHYISQQDARANRKDEDREKNKFQEQYDAELASTLAEDEAPAEPAVKSASVVKTRTNKPKVATPAEIAAQKKKDDDKLAQMVSEDDNKKS